LRRQGQTLEMIGRHLGRSAATLSRELRRDHTGQRGRYSPQAAQQKAEARRRQSHQWERLKSPALRQEVERLLKRWWSPQLIAGHLKRYRPELPSISHEAIYQWIYGKRRDLIRWLVRSRPIRDLRKASLSAKLRR